MTGKRSYIASFIAVTIVLVVGLYFVPWRWVGIYILTQSAIKPISFYGRVVDQYGHPVSGAEVEYDGWSDFLAAGSGRGRTLSGDDGLFVVRCKGAGLSILNISKEGHDFSHGLKPYTSVTQQSDFESYRRFSDSVLWRDYGKDNPYLYRVWRIENDAAIDRGEWDFAFEADGSAHAIDFVHRKMWKARESGEGDLQVSFAPTEEGWAATLVAVNGGLQENRDLYANLAPATGYTKTLVLQGASASADEVATSFYLAAHQGAVYGHLRTAFMARQEGRVSMHVRYVVNVEGGRGLIGHSAPLPSELDECGLPRKAAEAAAAAPEPDGEASVTVSACIPRFRPFTMDGVTWF